MDKHLNWLVDQATLNTENSTVWKTHRGHMIGGLDEGEFELIQWGCVGTKRVRITALNYESSSNHSISRETNVAVLIFLSHGTDKKRDYGQLWS